MEVPFEAIRTYFEILHASKPVEPDVRMYFTKEGFVMRLILFPSGHPNEPKLACLREWAEKLGVEPVEIERNFFSYRLQIIGEINGVQTYVEASLWTEEGWEGVEPKLSWP